MESMNRRGIILLALLVIALPCGAVAQELSAVGTVYLLPMSSSLEQYIANHLTRDGVLQVVTDPAQADAILTGEIGPGFEQKLDELYPPPPNETDATTEDDAGTTELVLQNTGRPAVSSFARGRGNVFLVGRQSGQVLWSFYHLPKNSTSKQLNRAANRIVDELRKTLGQ